MGGPSTEAGLQALTGSTQDKARISKEQHAWDWNNVDALLKRDLGPIITRVKGFIDPPKITARAESAMSATQLDEMTRIEQILKLLGRAPAIVAQQYLEAWLKEL
jgi:hypothetical protein